MNTLRRSAVSLTPSITLALLLAACGGGGGDAAPPAEQPQSKGLAVSQPGELATYVQGRLRARVAAQQAHPGAVFGAAPASDVAALPGTAAALPRSGTTLLEAGVDEPDLLQAGAEHLYTLQALGDRARLQVYERGADGRALARAALELPSDGAVNIDTPGMVFSADQRALAVLSQRWQPGGVLPAAGGGATGSTVPPTQWWRSSVAVQRVDVGTPGAAALGESVAIDGRLVDGRRIGNRLYVVTSHTPRLALDLLPPDAGAADREAAIAALRSSDLLPKQRRNGGAAAPLLSDTDCWLQPANGSLQLQITTVTVFDLASPTLAHSSRCFVGGSEALHMTAQSLYLATTRTTYYGEPGVALAYPPGMRTDIHKFAFAADGSLSYRGSGEVAGHLGWDPQLKPLRLSEHQGRLRVLSFTGSEGWADAPQTATAPSPATLTVLREGAAGQDLQPVATLPSSRRPTPLGKPGEQVHGVRFDGPRAYLVTFRRIDPLYVLDLADADDPKIAGILEVPGFSDQLFPLAGGLLLGVGRDVPTSGPDAGRPGGVKVALFDVADAAAPKLLHSLVLGAGGSRSALDTSRHGINWRVADGVARIALPVSLADDAGWLGGLQRFEVDLAARTLRPRAMVGGRDVAPYSGAGAERSLQVGDFAYYFNELGLAGYAW